MLLRLFFMLSLIIGICSCSKAQRAEYVITESMRFGDSAREIIDGLAVLRTSRVPPTIYEGLPNRYTQVYRTEKKREDVITFEDDDFYDHPLRLEDETKTSLREILANPETYLPPRQKDCDGFHADWAIQWDLGTDQIRMHLCFGCEEARIFYKGRTAWCDLNHPSRDKLRALLIPYRKHDPNYNRDAKSNGS